MAKKYKHWCDKEHEPPKDTHFIIGEMCGKLYTSMENYLITDINKDMSVVFADTEQTRIARNYVVKKLYNMLDKAEELESTVYGANAIYGWYDIDFAERRKGWTKARRLCYEIKTQLNHMGTKTLKGTNLQKYVDLARDAEKIGDKIKNMISADDKKRKDNPRKYVTDVTE